MCRLSIAPNGESITANRVIFRPGEACRGRRTLPWGRIGLSILLTTCVFRRFTGRSQRRAPRLSRSRAFTQQTGEAHWHVLISAGDRERLLRHGRRHRARHARERTRDLSAIRDRIHGAGLSRKAGGARAVVMATIDPAEVASARGRVQSLQNAAASRLPSRSPTLCRSAPSGSTRVIVYASAV